MCVAIVDQSSFSQRTKTLFFVFRNGIYIYRIYFFVQCLQPPDILRQNILFQMFFFSILFSKTSLTPGGFNVCLTCLTLTLHTATHWGKKGSLFDQLCGIRHCVLCDWGEKAACRGWCETWSWGCFFAEDFLFIYLLKPIPVTYSGDGGVGGWGQPILSSPTRDCRVQLIISVLQGFKKIMEIRNPAKW